MQPGAKVAFIFAALAASGGAYYLLTPACACVTPDRKAHGQLNSDIGRVIQAEQAFRKDHGHYAGTVEELGNDARPSSSEITLSVISDTSVRLDARSMNPGITCTMDVTPHTKEDSFATCTGHTGNR